jgi:ATP-dependent DNA helicase RecG
MLEQVASGEAALVVGTHAVIEEQVRFARLGLAIVDEQHRFGVYAAPGAARKAAGGPPPRGERGGGGPLHTEGEVRAQLEPHMLMMSATRSAHARDDDIGLRRMRESASLEVIAGMLVFPFLLV